MKCQEQLEQYLRERKVGYQIQHHPQAYTAQQIAEREHISGKRVAKSVVVQADASKVLLVLPASQRVDLSRVRAILGAQEVHLANEEDLRRLFPNCDVGAMPPFGNLYSLPVYVERSLTTQESIVFPIGTHTETMSLAYLDFERLVQPTVAEFALRPMAV